MNIFDIFSLDKKIEILDIGAAIIYELPIYDKLIDLGFANLNGFDGDERQIKELKEKYKDNIKIYNQYIFDGTDQKLYVANKVSGMTSLFKPNKEVLNFFNGFVNFGEIEKIETVKTSKLDDINDLPLIEFAKLDVQGAELTILKNGTNKLENCLAMQLEVSYICLYENQPSFGDIDLWMRSQGFLPHRFLEIKRWSIKPTIFNNDIRSPGNQLLESDIIYIRDPFKLNLLDDEQLKKFATIAHYSFKSIDLCCFILIELEKRKVIEKDSFKKYLMNSKKFI